jgi:hypothetical protein
VEERRKEKNTKNVDTILIPWSWTAAFRLQLALGILKSFQERVKKRRCGQSIQLGFLNELTDFTWLSISKILRLTAKNINKIQGKKEQDADSILYSFWTLCQPPPPNRYFHPELTVITNLNIPYEDFVWTQETILSFLVCPCPSPNWTPKETWWIS